MQLNTMYVQLAIALFLLKPAPLKLQPMPTALAGAFANERSALAHFKAGLLDPGNLLSSWLGDDCCRWKGVHCSKKNGHVIKLDLQGADCTEGPRLGGNISSSLVGLQHLRYLDLSCNSFSGLPIPEFLPSLHKLRYLDLSSSGFVGRIPPQLGNLSNLRYLSMSSNQFSGPFPDEIGNMTSMISLDLSDNNLVGMIPSNLKNLCNLEELVVSYNNINGSITEIFRRLPSCSWNKLSLLSLGSSNLTGSLPAKLEPLRNLTWLDLGYNQLIGRMPLWIGELRKLTVLALMDNNMDGIIHEGHLWGLRSLKMFSLTGNSITIKVNSTWVPPFNLTDIELNACFLGPKFPLWLRWQTPDYLDISNTSITDTVPDWFWIMASSAGELNMKDNQLGGFLPSTMESMRAYAMDLSSNQFSGPVPKLPANLIFLDLSRNKLSGLPLDIGAPQLEVLLMYENSISGPIPSFLCKLQSLGVLDLSENKLTGSIPDCLVNESTTNKTSLSIQNLSLRNNNLSGEFPLFLRNCQQLMFLDLTHNKFSGTLPAWIGEKLPLLAFLRLRSNMFYGHIPIELTKLINLQYLDLSYNNMSGSIPISIVNCTGMILKRVVDHKLLDPLSSTYKGMIHYTENFTIVTKGQERLYTGEIVYMVNLDLSCNSMTGEIPEEIGALLSLKSLNLSWNAFSAKIPQKIGALVQVESLDLSHNELSGEIPTSLSALTSLSRLNLSFNNLTGEIPSGNQLQTLDDQESIYAGNPGLCGPPLSRKCPGNESIPATPKHQEDHNDMVSFFLAMGSGYVMGLWVVFCTFLFKRKWRICWFSFYDSLCDRVYVQVAVSWASWTRKNG